MVTALCFFSKKSIFKKSCPLTCSTPTYNHSVTCLGLPAPPRCHKTQACRDHQEPPCSMSRRHFQSSGIGLSMASDDTAYRVHWDALFSSLRFSSEPLNSPGNSFSALSLSSVRALPHAHIHIPQTLKLLILWHCLHSPPSPPAGFQVQTFCPQFLDCLLPPPI